MAPNVKKVFDTMKKRSPQDFPEARDFGGLQVKTIRNTSTGDTYQGTVERGLPHGWGFFVTKSGEYIEGIFVNGSPESRIRQITADGACFEGTFRDHKRNGKGILTNPQGTTIKCDQWVNGVTGGYYEESDSNGKILFKGAKGSIGYDGPCQFDRQGFVINSNYKNGRLQGLIKKSYTNATLYEGIVDDNFVENGQGTITYPDGRKWNGPFVNGKPNGEGTFTSDSGKSSKQTWKDGRRI